MPRLARTRIEADLELKDKLHRLFSTWRNFNLGKAESLADLIAIQYNTERQYIDSGAVKMLSVTERVRTVQQYVSALHKARKYWSELQDEDQVSLAGSLGAVVDEHQILQSGENCGLIDKSFTAGGVLPPRLKEYASDEPEFVMPVWRRALLGQYEKWNADTEMLDALIGAAQHWLTHSAPTPYSKTDTLVRAVVYICDACADHDVTVSASRDGRLVQIVNTYIEHSGRELKGVMRLVKAAKKIWEDEYKHLPNY